MRNEPYEPKRTEAPQRRRRLDESGASEVLSDVTSEFWGASRDWTAEHRRPRDPLTGSNAKRVTSSNTGMIAAIRDGVAAFKPQLRDESGPIERTRTHGVIDASATRPVEPPAKRRRPRSLPVADSHASIAELAAGEADHDFEPHPWEQSSKARGGRGNRRAATSAAAPAVPTELDHTGPIAFFDREVDEYGFIGSTDLDDEFENYAQKEFATAAGNSWMGGLGLRSSRATKVAALVVATVAALPFLWSGRGDGKVQTADAVVASAGATLPTALPTTLPAAPAAAAAQPATNGAATARPSANSGAAAAASSGSKPASNTGAASNTAKDSSSDAVATSDSAMAAAPAATTVTTSVVAQIPESEDPPAAAPTTAAPTTAALTTAAPTTTQPACASRYQAGPGDSWYRIADEAGISPKTLLALNQANLDTVILPGDEICLPAGASKPTPPTTTAAPTTTDAPATTAPPKTTAAPKPVSSTTAAPAATTTVPAGSPGRNATPAQVQQIIRDVFPDDAEAKALDVARLESSYSPTAYNGWCCYGIFQIYYSVHAKWLTNFGVNKAEDLYDPVINAKVALEIYRRAGNSFRPWTTA